MGVQDGYQEIILTGTVVKHSLEQGSGGIPIPGSVKTAQENVTLCDYGLVAMGAFGQRLDLMIWGLVQR